MKEKFKRNWKLFLRKAVIVYTVFFVACSYTRCYAISNTTAAKGIKNLASDLTSYLLIIIPIAGGLYMLITWVKQMGESDEMDEKPHKKKIKSIFFVIIAAECASGIINVLVNNYFNG